MVRRSRLVLAALLATVTSQAANAAPLDATSSGTAWAVSSDVTSDLEATSTIYLTGTLTLGGRTATGYFRLWPTATGADLGQYPDYAPFGHCDSADTLVVHAPAVAVLVCRGHIGDGPTGAAVLRLTMPEYGHTDTGRESFDWHRGTYRG